MPPNKEIEKDIYMTETIEPKPVKKAIRKKKPVTTKRRKVEKVIIRERNRKVDTKLISQEADTTAKVDIVSISKSSAVEAEVARAVQESIVVERQPEAPKITISEYTPPVAEDKANNTHETPVENTTTGEDTGAGYSDSVTSYKIDAIEFSAQSIFKGGADLLQRPEFALSDRDAHELARAIDVKTPQISDSTSATIVIAGIIAPRLLILIDVAIDYFKTKNNKLVKLPPPTAVTTNG